MHSFEVHSNESACRKSGRFGLEQVLRTLVRVGALHQFDLLSADVESTQTLNIEDIIKYLAHYLPPVNLLLKKKRSMRRGMKTTYANCKTK